MPKQNKFLHLSLTGNNSIPYVSVSFPPRFSVNLCSESNWELPHLKLRWKALSATRITGFPSQGLEPQTFGQKIHSSAQWGIINIMRLTALRKCVKPLTTMKCYKLFPKYTFFTGPLTWVYVVGKKKRTSHDLEYSWHNFIPPSIRINGMQVIATAESTSYQLLLFLLVFDFT